MLHDHTPSNEYQTMHGDLANGIRRGMANFLGLWLKLLNTHALSLSLSIFLISEVFDEVSQNRDGRADASCACNLLLLLFICGNAVIQQACSTALSTGMLSSLGTALFCCFLPFDFWLPIHPHWFHARSCPLVHGGSLLLRHATHFHPRLENCSHDTCHCSSEHITFDDLGF